MDAKFTPGPWTAIDSPGAGLGIWADLRPSLGDKFSANFPIYGSGDLPAPKVQIAYEQWVQFPSAEWEAVQRANAQLIAAAPELLDACRKALGVIAGDDMNKQALIDSLTLLRSAIAKATGEAA